MNTSYEIKGKTALVTGVNRGIGKAIVKAFIDSGVAKVYAAVRDLQSATPLVKEYGKKIVPIRIDLNLSDTITNAAAKAQDVDIVVNNAGIVDTTGAVDEDAIESLNRLMQTNVYGLIQMAQAFAPILSKNGGGVFVQLNSIASVKCVPAAATYCASKSAAYAITQGLSTQLAENGTSVLSVHPGAIATDMVAGTRLAEIAAPASVVATGIVKAIQAGDFHLFTDDALAQKIGSAYQSYAKKIVETDLMVE